MSTPKYTPSRRSPQDIDFREAERIDASREAQLARSMSEDDAAMRIDTITEALEFAARQTEDEPTRERLVQAVTALMDLAAHISHLRAQRDGDA